MQPVHSFDSHARADARVLVLGSMPGRVSLEAVRYYAHPRNSFWRIMTELFEWEEGLEYEARIERLMDEGVALWDVLKSCVRPGSLDADILEESIVPNDFEGLLRARRRIRHVFFNGGKAEESFRRHVLPTLGELAEGLVLERLPSTSPAHAGMRFEEKRERWRRLLVALAQPPVR